MNHLWYLIWLAYSGPGALIGGDELLPDFDEVGRLMRRRYGADPIGSGRVVGAFVGDASLDPDAPATKLVLPARDPESASLHLIELSWHDLKRG